jgi:hypothetical protein
MRDFKGMKRQRGRNNRGGGNTGGKPQQHNANRAFDSNGPDGVKVRGAAQGVYEKYQQLARDATSSGDRVLAENYLQHAEHYFRVLRAIQPNRAVSDIIGKDAYSAYEIDFEAEPDENAYAAEPEPAPEAESDGQRDDRQNRDRFENRPRDDRPRDDRPQGGQGGQGGQGEGDSHADCTITLVALTAATAGAPTTSPSSSTASRVIAAVMRWGPASISTSAMTPSTSTDRTMPWKRLRADSGVPVWWRSSPRRRRVTSRAGTRRRLRASRVVRSCPARSQRRRVSMLTPIALAASPIERSSMAGDSCIGGA